MNHRIDALQALRAIAAISVVVHHVLLAIYKHSPDRDVLSLSTGARWGIDLLASGVDLFFVLSGFLMFHIAGPYVLGKRSTGHFLVHRLVRVWPVYAIATTLMLLLMLYRSKGAPIFDMQPIRLLSYLFVPSFNEIGSLQPIIGVGWTLNYEMLFYLLFALALLVRRIPLILSVAALLLSVILLARLFPEGSVIGTFAGNLILLEFLIGGMIALAHRSGHLARLPAVPTLLTGLALLLALAWVSSQDPLRFLARGVPAAIIFMGMLRLGNTVRWSRLTLLLGNASYSIYLLHILVIYELMYRMRFTFDRLGMLDYWVAAAIPLLSLASIVVGVAFYLMIEKPLLAMMHAHLRSSGQPGMAIGAEPARLP